MLKCREAAESAGMGMEADRVNEETAHRSVLWQEVMEALAVRPEGRYIDTTLGGGGHSRGILERLGPGGRLLALDRDPEALARTGKALAPWSDRLTLVHGRFGKLAEYATEQDMKDVDGIVMDLGISSDQLDDPRRGFSFSREGPLDMRMDPTTGASAADLVNSAPAEELAEWLWTYGEERLSRRIARAIVAARPLHTTAELAAVVEKAAGGRRGRIHPATRTFQALRIRVNRELEELEAGLTQGLNLLTPGGRLAVIAFHSLEDRIVKQTFRAHEGRWESLPEGGADWIGREPACRAIHRRPVVAKPEETASNPRARSAKLRVTERKHHG